MIQIAEAEAKRKNSKDDGKSGEGTVSPSILQYFERVVCGSSLPQVDQNIGGVKTQVFA